MTDLNPEETPRQLIGRMLLEASKCEEMLDAFGAPNNEYWSPVRMTAALAKAFSRVIYNLFHIYLSADGYQLMEVDGDFIGATRESTNMLMSSFSTASASFMKLAKKMNLDHDLRPLEDFHFHDPPMEGVLQANRKGRSVHKPRDTAVYLATNLLNLAEKSTWLDIYRKIEPDQYHTCIPDVVSEERLRSLSNNFHSLQSLYDTYLSGSDIAEMDKNLPVMRGHITVIFHLLDTAETLTHFYERHASKNWNKKLKRRYPTKNSWESSSGISLLIQISTSSPPPNCAGISSSPMPFRVKLSFPYQTIGASMSRPSTLIAKIAIHYGSEVTMLLGSAVYDASLPLELFRANEELNRRKRDAVARYVMEHKLIKNDAGATYDEPLMKKILRVIFLDLLEKQKIMIYNNDFSFEDLTPYENETLAEFIKRAIALYLAMGKIDIVSDDTVSFQGDMRVLEDIRTLAEHGYGEDKFGNNIVLPPELSYLKR
jgi:hypothetical protein